MTPPWVACLTPPGTAAIAVIGMRGPNAWHIVRQFLHPFSRSGRSLPDIPKASQSWLGRWGDANGPADEVLLVIRRVAPEPWIEIQCHGGAEVVRWMMEVLTAAGATACSWERLEQQSVDEPLRGAALTALGRASTVRTAGILLDQYHGAFARALHETVVAIDSADNDRAENLLARLVKYAGVGSHLTTPWRVAMAGPPNVGKSSLVNTLAGYQRSLVSPVPGTTRDVVTTMIGACGWPIELMDTAGVRTGAADLENEGIALGRDAARAADLCLWLMDATAAPVWPEVANVSVKLVVNKTDLSPAWDLHRAAGAVRVSAQTGAGITDLVQALAECLVPEPPVAGEAVPFTPVLAQAVKEAMMAWTAGNVMRTRKILQGLGERSSLEAGN